MRTHPRIAPMLAASLALAACGGGGSGGSPAPPTGPGPNTSPPPPAPSASITMRSSADAYGVVESSFVPSQVSVARNGNVTWTNETGVSHNVTFDAASGAPANIASHTSGTTVRTFATAGSFAFRCTNHEGMTGTVTVAP